MPKSCLFHEGVPAVVHCYQCHKPVCAQCVKATKGGKFCSASCAAAHAEMKEKMGGLQTKRAASALAGFVGTAVKLVLALALAAGALHAAVRFGKLDALRPYDLVGRWLR